MSFDSAYTFPSNGIFDETSLFHLVNEGYLEENHLAQVAHDTVPHLPFQPNAYSSWDLALPATDNSSYVMPMPPVPPAPIPAPIPPTVGQVESSPVHAFYNHLAIIGSTVDLGTRIRFWKDLEKEIPSSFPYFELPPDVFQYLSSGDNVRRRSITGNAKRKPKWLAATKAPRALNVWFIYRNVFNAHFIANGGLHQNNLSKIASEAWNAIKNDPVASKPYYDKMLEYEFLHSLIFPQSNCQKKSTKRIKRRIRRTDGAHSQAGPLHDFNV